MHARLPRLGVVAQGESATTRGLVRACTRLGVEGVVLTPERALAELGPADAALGRLDVRRTLDGVERGLWELRVLEREGVRVLNPASALVAAHDKLATAARLAAAGVPHPRTVEVGPGALAPPLVLKPRFGSWGLDVFLCEDEGELAAVLARLDRACPWFHSAGAVAQELVPPNGRDLRAVVAGARVVGAVERIAPPGEWRTNVALGAARRPAEPPADACGLAIAAVAAVGADLAGVDLMRLPDSGWTVLEVNGAVDFTRLYRRESDVFEAAVEALLDSGSPPLSRNATQRLPIGRSAGRTFGSV
jgi:[lysine-biosynthesis-protein LysW]--L-2-aminoadipate ligase